MEFNELVREKSLLIIQMNRARADNKRREVHECASRAATLETQVADIYLQRSDNKNAMISLTSAASCLSIAERPRESARLYHAAMHFADNETIFQWISARLDELSHPPLVFDVFSTPVNIEANASLRPPQVGAYVAAKSHFATSSEHAIIQLPVGCGKTGTMALLPFNISRGRVLVIAPNLEIGRTLCENLDITRQGNFWSKTNVLLNGLGPHCAELNSDANILDCDNSEFVITNIQQIVSQSKRRWLDKFSTDYFDMLFIDEGHHNAAASWQSVIDHFPKAKVVSFTATPLRSDGKKVEGKRIYHFPISRAIREGYVKDIASRRLEPSEIFFTFQGEEHRHTLEEINNLRENRWFSRGVALSTECNRSIVDASIQCMKELRDGSDEKHQIIAVACSIDHARAIRSLYNERGIESEVLHSEMPEDEQQRIRALLNNKEVDAIVQVSMLGEGADYPSLSVAAIFRPFRHMVPYVQFVGRIMRVLKERQPGHPDNRGFVVTHIGLNVDRWWEELHCLDEGDQEFFEEIASANRDFEFKGNYAEPNRRRRFIPEMQVLEERIEYYVQSRFLPEDTEAIVDDLIHTMKERGLDPDLLGISREEISKRLLASQQEAERRIAHAPLPVSPQKARMEARKRLNERVRSGAKELLNALGYQVTGYQLPKSMPAGGATNNLSAAIIILNKEVQLFLGVSTDERDLYSLEQLVKAHDSMDIIIDRVLKRLRG